MLKNCQYYKIELQMLCIKYITYYYDPSLLCAVSVQLRYCVISSLQVKMSLIILNQNVALFKSKRAT